jgi:BirA family biotin operon repressor/biotin-[acetyl-CoA-carboxylase] ligase
MRWPNDVLIGDRKLAGLLLDQFAPALCVVGIGINVLNQPEVLDASLNNQTARLADLIPAQPELSELMALVLRNLRRVVQDLECAGFESLIPRVNQLWLTPRRVELDLDGALHRGVFTGVDREGHLMLLDDKASSRTYAAYQVRHLQEI